LITGIYSVITTILIVFQEDGIPAMSREEGHNYDILNFPIDIPTQNSLVEEK
jgi:hypothetical protein